MKPQYPNISKRKAAAGLARVMIGLDGGFLSCAFVWRERAGGRVASPVMSEAPTCPMVEDGWLQTTRSKRNVPAAPSGNSEEMIHFRHHFTQDDLITFREWTVPRMRTWWSRRVEAEPGMCAITCHLWHGV